MTFVAMSTVAFVTTTAVAVIPSFKGTGKHAHFQKCISGEERTYTYR